MQLMKEQVIFDVGMHTGKDTDYYLKKGFKVIAIEANPALVKINRDTFEKFLLSGSLTICDVAIANCEGEINFYINDQHDDWGTISSDFASRNEKLGTQNKIIKVKSQRFSTLLEKYGIPYYLKIDIEGADILCLEGLENFDQKPKYISIESGLTSFEETFGELSLLWRLGYKSFKIINQANNEKLRCPNPALEGLFVDYKFDSTSSGMFGEELLGEWMTIEDTIIKYRYLLSEQKWFGANGKLYQTFFHRAYNLLKGERVGWYDFHAKLG